MNARLDPSAAAPRDDMPGRTCPLHYGYAPEVFARPADVPALEVLYVVGGLYGNELALDRVLELFAAERGRAWLVFNGDFHWFDADPEVFARVQRQVLAHTALRGNVETELAAEPAGADDDAGCGCAYPEWVGDAVVERSNRIMRRLRMATTPVQCAELADLPMTLRADVGDLKLGIVHGDAQSLAGWGFAQEHLRESAHRDDVRGWFARAQVDAFACTHTCLPVFQRLRSADYSSARWVLNNGAAGMPNFSGDADGLLTRIALHPFDGSQRRFGVRQGEVFIDAIAIETDATQAQARFLRQWTEGSDAHASYFQRIAHGPAYRVDEAIRLEE
ncbi:MAG: hypothetical protein H0X13_09755 [Ramlibacter sp.]|nr:hypothetical protein [Ramlibacter sp.]